MFKINFTMKNRKLMFIIYLLVIIPIHYSCDNDNRYDECMEYYIDSEDYYYQDAKDLCREEMDDYHV